MAVATETNTEKPFDAQAFITRRNEAEQAARASKPAETKTETTTAAAAAGADTKPAGQQAGDGEPHERMSRSARREMNRLLEENGRLAGQIEMLKQLGMLKADGTAATAAGKPETKVDDPEPQRKDYADDAQYQRALGRWEARQEANKVLAKKDEQTTQAQQAQQFREQIQAMNEKAEEDKKLFPDWDTVRTAAEEDDVTFVAEEHPQLMTMIALSDVKAGVLYHLAKHPKDMEALLSLTAKPAEQIKMFHRLEGRIERLYYSDESAAQAGQGAKPGDGKASTGKDRQEPEKGKNERRSAALPAPTESASATGGSTPAGDVKPILANGKLNPAWKAQRNERAGQRR